MPSLYHTISKSKGDLLNSYQGKENCENVTKIGKTLEKQGLSAVRDIELHMRTMGEMSVHKLFTQMVKESQK